MSLLAFVIFFVISFVFRGFLPSNISISASDFEIDPHASASFGS